MSCYELEVQAIVVLVLDGICDADMKQGSVETRAS